MSESIPGTLESFKLSKILSPEAERRRTVLMFSTVALVLALVATLIIMAFQRDSREARLEYVRAACPCGVHTDDGDKLQCQPCSSTSKAP